MFDKKTPQKLNKPCDEQMKLMLILLKLISFHFRATVHEQNRMY